MDALRKTKIDDHVMVGGPIEFDAKGQNVNIKGTALASAEAQHDRGAASRMPPRPTLFCPQARLERQAPDLIKLGFSGAWRSS